MGRAIEILKAGTFRPLKGPDITLSDADLAAMAAAYRPELHEAPLVVGHPKTDDPAYGWVEKLEFADGVLRAVPHQVDAQFAQAVRAGRFKRISASLFRPGSAGNPAPGGWYLRHVGFLGAAVPAVTGLKPASLAGTEDDGITVELGACPPDTNLSKEEDMTLTPEQLAAKEAELKQQEADLAQRTEDFGKREEDLKARETKVKDEAEAARRKGFADFADGLAGEGRLLPREKAAIVELMAGIPETATVDLADGGETRKVAGLAFFQDFLKALPPRVDLGERAPDEKDPGTVEFAGPRGVQVDSEAAALHAKARAFQAKHPDTDYLTAVKAVGGK